MVEHLNITLKVKVVSLKLVRSKVSESMMMVAPSGDQIKSLKSYNCQYCIFDERSFEFSISKN